MSNSVQPHRWQPTRLPHLWDSPGKNTGVGCHFLLQCMKVKSESEVAQSCPTLSDPMDCSLPGSSVHGIFQARVLEWGAIAFPTVYIYIYIYIYISTPFYIHFSYRSLQSIEQSFPVYIVGFCWLSILYIVVCICQSQISQFVSPPQEIFENIQKHEILMFQSFKNLL